MGEAMDMDTLAVEYRRSLDELRKRERRKGREQGIRKGREEGMQKGREQGVREGREQGIRQGREQGQVTILRQQTDRKFGPKTAERVSRLLAGTTDPAHFIRVSAAILECDTAEEFLAPGGVDPTLAGRGRGGFLMPPTRTPLPASQHRPVPAS